jgi:uncharacterized SAM-binding protein YcdF (DUF218 family)
MFFIISKIFFFFVSPVNWLLILFIWWWFTKKPIRKKRILIAIISIAVIFSNPFILYKTVLLWQTKPVTLPTNANYNAGIVLGGFTMFDKNDKGYFGGNADRFIQPLRLYKQKQINKIVLTGGIGNLFFKHQTEADFTRTEMIACGVDSNDIIIENKSKNTYENAIFTKKILDSLQVKGPYLLLTSALHMPRSLKVFNKAGFEVTAYPCAYDVIDSKHTFFDYILPDISLLSTWKYVIKEMVGMAVYNATGKG